MLSLHPLIEGKVINRPSKTIKSPYVADIAIVIDGKESNVLAHTASLGCCGLADTGATLLMTPIIHLNKSKDKLKCDYRAHLSILHERNTEIIIGIYPKMAEELTEIAIKNNLLKILPAVKNYKRESTIYVKGKINSRFDFIGTDCNDIPFIMEVKNVPLADYEDITLKERKMKNYDDRCQRSKVAYFPNGYRKKIADPISPRALHP
jgi:DNA-binding sugar fermentation-stimulating protein